MERTLAVAEAATRTHNGRPKPGHPRIVTQPEAIGGSVVLDVAAIGIRKSLIEQYIHGFDVVVTIDVRISESRMFGSNHFPKKGRRIRSRR